MSKKIYSLVLSSAVACSGSAASIGAKTAATAPVRTETRATETRAPVAKSEAPTLSAPRESHDANERDRVFVENAERAIGQYSEFIARAGDSEEYAPAVKRSREQIQDLQATLVFVRGGAAERAAH